MPYLTIATWPKVDVIGKVIFDVAALIGFLLLGRKIFAPEPGAHAAVSAD